jgi:hypothetical protein
MRHLTSGQGQKWKNSQRANVLPFAPESGQVKSCERPDHDGRLFVSGDQFGRTSAPIRPQAAQTILGHKDRTGISSGSPSDAMAATARWPSAPHAMAVSL